MISIDTNILIRFLTEDDDNQLKKVNSLFKQNAGSGNVFICLIVLIEANWVLKGIYQWSQDRICDAFEDILKCDEFCIESAGVLRMAISKTRKGQDFEDAIIGQIGVSKGYKTYTFDKKLKKDSAFLVLK